jgi:hypothetical protein
MIIDVHGHLVRHHRARRAGASICRGDAGCRACDDGLGHAVPIGDENPAAIVAATGLAPDQVDSIRGGLAATLFRIGE